MNRESVEGDDTSVRVVGDQRTVPPPIGGCFDERAHIVVTGGPFIRCRSDKDGIECEEWTGGD